MSKSNGIAVKRHYVMAKYCSGCNSMKTEEKTEERQKKDRRKTEKDRKRKVR